MRTRSEDRIDRLLRLLRRTLLTIFGAQLALAVGMSLVDSYRRRGKKSKPFPTTPPRTVDIGEGKVTAYTYGRDLYDDMLAAIEGAQRQILFETYIWKGDEVGERFKAALADAAARGVEVYCVYDGFANMVVSPRFKRFPAVDEGAALPRSTPPAGGSSTCAATAATTARSWSSTTRSASSAATTSARRTPPSGATPTSGSPGPGVWDLKRAFADFWNLNRRKRFGPSERPLLIETASTWEPQIRFHRNMPRLWMFPIRAMYLEAIVRASNNIWLTTAYFMPDQDFVDALDGRGAARGRRTHPGAAEVQPHRGRLDLARLLLPAARRRGADLPVPRRDGAREDRDHRRHLVDGRHRQHRPAQPAGQLRDQPRGHRRGPGQTLEEIFRVDESNCLELTSAEWEARDLHRKFTEFVLAPLRPLL